MRVLFTTQPAVSHLRSLVPVAEAARHLGHTVAVAAPAPFHPDIEPYGLPAVAAGPDWRPQLARGSTRCCACQLAGRTTPWAPT
jgi:UDP:flavonoid glycosyltransferase YjiC (YdhE family)